MDDLALPPLTACRDWVTWPVAPPCPRCGTAYDPRCLLASPGGSDAWQPVAGLE